MFAGEADIERAAGDRAGVTGIQRVDKDRAVGLADLRSEADVAVRRVERDQRLLLIKDAAEGVRTLAR